MTASTQLNPLAEELRDVIKAVEANGLDESNVIMRSLRKDVSGVNAMVIVALDTGDGSTIPAMILHAIETQTRMQMGLPPRKSGKG